MILEEADVCSYCNNFAEGMKRTSCGCIICPQCAYEEFPSIPIMSCPYCQKDIYPLIEDPKLQEKEKTIRVACRFHKAFSPYLSKCDFVATGLQELYAHSSECKLCGECTDEQAEKVYNQLYIAPMKQQDRVLQYKTKFCNQQLEALFDPSSKEYSQVCWIDPEKFPIIVHINFLQQPLEGRNSENLALAPV